MYHIILSFYLATIRELRDTKAELENQATKVKVLQMEIIESEKAKSHLEDQKHEKIHYEADFKLLDDKLTKIQVLFQGV